MQVSCAQGLTDDSSNILSRMRGIDACATCRKIAAHAGSRRTSCRQIHALPPEIAGTARSGRSKMTRRDKGTEQVFARISRKCEDALRKPPPSPSVHKRAKKQKPPAQTATGGLSAYSHLLTGTGKYQEYRVRTRPSDQNVKIASNPPQTWLLDVPSLNGRAVVPAKPLNQS
jgi:hypothetical protein